MGEEVSGSNDFMTAGGLMPQGSSEDPFQNAAPTLGGFQQPESDLTQEE